MPWDQVQTVLGHEDRYWEIWTFILGFRKKILTGNLGSASVPSHCTAPLESEAPPMMNPPEAEGAREVDRAVSSGPAAEPLRWLHRSTPSGGRGRADGRQRIPAAPDRGIVQAGAGPSPAEDGPGESC